MTDHLSPAGLILPRPASEFSFRAKAGYAPGMDAERRAASQTHSVMRNWNPPLTDPNSPWGWERDPAVARARDLVNNNGYAQAAADNHVAMTVGLELRYSARHELMAQRLGISPEDASILATQIELAWTEFFHDPLFRCDWEQQLDGPALVNLQARHDFVDGESLAVMRWEEDVAKMPAGWRWRASLQVLDPDRLSNPIARMNGPLPDGGQLTNGIETDGRRVTAYHIREAHPADPAQWGKAMRWERVPARTEYGRPVVLHTREKTRAGQQRGVSKLVACLRAFKQLDIMTEAELSNAALNAIFGVAIKTAKQQGEIAEALNVEAMQAQSAIRQAWYDGADPRLSNGARVVALAPGDEMDFNTASRVATNFQAFLKTTLQGVAAASGLADVHLTMDYSGENFSTWRGKMLQVWRGVLQSRRRMTAQSANLMLLCVVEEGIENGAITPPAGCPDLYENTAGWLAGRWIGPARGTIDPKGEVDGANARVAGGFSTLEDEALELGGNDYEAVAGQTEHEVELWKRRGLTPTAHLQLSGKGAAPGAAAPVAPPPADENSTESPPEEGGDKAAAPAAA